jgi:hypothetical protein
MGPTAIGLALLLALLALVPTRRLASGGARRETLAAYFLGVWLLSVFAVVAGGPRVLLAVVLVAYVAPFVTLGAGLDALRRRFAPRPLKDVTPRDEGQPPG